MRHETIRCKHYLKVSLSGPTHGNAFLFGSGSQKKYKQSPDHYAIDNPLFEAIDQMYPEQKSVSCLSPMV